MDIITIILYIITAALVGVILFEVVPFIFGAPFEPSRKRAVEKMLKLADIKKGDKMADLGSGEGRLVIEFAKKGAEAHGFEINPALVLLSKRKIATRKLNGKAFIHLKNFWKVDLSKFDIITLFQINYVMPKLEEKILKEMKKGSKIVSNTWKFPNLKPKKSIGDIYLYEV